MNPLALAMDALNRAFAREYVAPVRTPAPVTRSQRLPGACCDRAVWAHEVDRCVCGGVTCVVHGHECRGTLD